MHFYGQCVVMKSVLEDLENDTGKTLGGVWFEHYDLESWSLSESWLCCRLSK